MKAIVLLGLLTGLDNLQVTPALGLMTMTARRRLAWALMFGLAEALMPLLGLGFGFLLHRSFSTWADKFGPIMLMLCGATIVIMAFRENDLDAIVSSKWTIIGLPLSLSLDNLLAGLGVGTGGAPILVSALIIGGLSTAMGLIGLYAGHVIRRWLPGTPEFFSGGYLLLLGLCGFFGNPLH